MDTRVLKHGPEMRVWPDTEPGWERPRGEALVVEAPPSPRPVRMSYEEFLEWADEDTLAEWVRGEVIMTSPASRRHQEIMVFLGLLVHQFVEVYRLGTVLLPPFQMKLPYSGREPDLIFVAEEHRGRLRKNRLEGPGDLVVEIVSPESRVRDRKIKLREYEEAGVPEYWLVDPLVERLTVYLLDEGGRYEQVFDGREGEYRSRHLPGFWVRAEWLWQRPLPTVMEVLLQVGGETYVRALLDAGRDDFAREMIEQLRARGFLE